MATVPSPLSNIMDIFRGAPVNPQQTGGPQNSGNPNTAPNGVVPPMDQNNDPNAQNNPQSNPQGNQNNPQGNSNQADPNKKTTPLDQFEKLWEPVKVDPNASGNTALDFNNIDPQKMMEAARKVDFSAILTPETQAAIGKGGEDGVKATIQAMNQVAQLVYGQSAMATTKIVGAAVETARNQFAAQIPDLVRAAALQNNLVKSNPVFQNPALAPIVEGLKSQFITKFPNATPDQLTTMAQEYFMGVAQAFPQLKVDPTKTTKPVKNMTGKGEEDWGAFFDVPVNS